MIRVSRVAAVAAVLLFTLWGAASAHASGWPFAQSGEITLGYAEEYQRPDGSTAVHSGVDIAAETNAEVVAIVSGTVSFVGSVPRADGGTALAITVESDDGEKWSYLPFERTTVQPGDAVLAGETLGRLASSGDFSSDTAHIHVGLRRGERYVDPTAYLVAPVVPSEAVEDQALSAQSVETQLPAPSASGNTGPSVNTEAASSAEVPRTTANGLPQGTAHATEPGASMSITTTCVRRSTATLHDPETFLRSVSRTSDSGALAVAHAAAASVEPDSGDAVSEFGSRALMAAGCLGLLAVVSSCDVIRERIAALRESVAAAVSR